jgi:hypothetical protein
VLNYLCSSKKPFPVLLALHTSPNSKTDHEKNEGLIALLALPAWIAKASPDQAKINPLGQYPYSVAKNNH